LIKLPLPWILMGIWYETPGRGRKKCPECGRYVPSKLRGQPCPVPDCTHVWKGRQKAVKWADAVKLGRLKVSEAAWKVLERAKWDLDRAKTLLRDALKPQTTKQAATQRKCREERREKEEGRRKRNREVLEINEKIRVVIKKWREKEEERLADYRAWDSKFDRYVPQSEEQREKNKQQEHKQEQWKKKNRKWREEEVTKILGDKTAMLLWGVAEKPLEPIHLDEERSDNETAVRLLRRAGGLAQALRSLERAWEGRQGWLDREAKELLHTVLGDTAKAEQYLHLGFGREAKSLLESAGGIRNALDVLRRIVAEAAESSPPPQPPPPPPVTDDLGETYTYLCPECGIYWQSPEASDDIEKTCPKCEKS